MTNRIKTIVSLLLATGVMAFGAAAHADSFTVNLSTEFSGGAEPEGSTPWLVLIVDDSGTAGSVSISLEARNLTDDEFVRNFYMNFDPTRDVLDLAGQGSLANIGDINLTNGCALGNNAFGADGAGRFDMFCDFQMSAGSGRFTDGEIFVLNLTGPAYLTANDFNFMNTGPGGNCCWTTASHIQSIDTRPGSGWIGGDPGDDHKVPEPGTLALFGLGLTAMGFVTRRRRIVPKS